MKHIKKLLSILMVLTLVLSLGASAFADGDGANITVNDKNGEGSTYEAYQLLTLTTRDGADPENGYDATEEGYAYLVNPKYKTILETITNLTDTPDPQYGSSIVRYIYGLSDTELREFADKVFAAIEAADPAIVPDGKSVGNTISNMPQGYYLIAEVLGEGSEAVRSLVMLDTAGKKDIQVNTKEDVPHVEKEIVDGDNGSLDTTSAGVGKKVTFKLIATLPSDYAAYENYQIKFNDTMSNGLTFAGNVKIMVGDTDVSADFTVTQPTTTNGGDLFIESKNLKGEGIVGTYVAGTQVVVTYDVTVNDAAVIAGKGNPNEVFLEYTNDPYWDGEGEPPYSPTPKDTVVVFTFDMDVDKVQPDGEDRTKPLQGAGFTLLKEAEALGTEEQVTWEELGTKTPGTHVKYGDKTYEIIGVLNDIGPGTTFDFAGIGIGNYRLAETKVPDGYNRADDIDFTVSATYKQDATGEWYVDSLTAGSFNTNITLDTSDVDHDAAIEGDVLNRTGVELPETGGIGTTIFYVIGAVLVAAAVVLLVTKKRMSGADK